MTVFEAGMRDSVVAGYELEIMSVVDDARGSCGDSKCELSCWEVKVDLSCGGGQAPGSGR